MKTFKIDETAVANQVLDTPIIWDTEPTKEEMEFIHKVLLGELEAIKRELNVNMTICMDTYPYKVVESAEAEDYRIQPCIQFRIEPKNNKE